MALISLRQLLDHAAEHRYGLPAFNINNMEQIHSIMQAAAECDSPVILQASAGHANTRASLFCASWWRRPLSNTLIFRSACIKIMAHRRRSARAAYAVVFRV